MAKYLDIREGEPGAAFHTLLIDIYDMIRRNYRRGSRTWFHMDDGRVVTIGVA